LNLKNNNNNIFLKTSLMQKLFEEQQHVSLLQQMQASLPLTLFTGRQQPISANISASSSTSSLADLRSLEPLDGFTAQGTALHRIQFSTLLALQEDRCQRIDQPKRKAVAPEEPFPSIKVEAPSAKLPFESAMMHKPNATQATEGFSPADKIVFASKIKPVKRTMMHPRKSILTKNPAKHKKNDTKWLASLEKLREYKRLNGDCIVLRGYLQNPRLASWVAEQRKQYKLSKDGKLSSITQERINLLNELDFAWNAQGAAWTRHMASLRSFRDEFGHCNVPLNHAKYEKLGLWVKEQRRHYLLSKKGKPSHMTAQRIKELDSIGFCWDSQEATWLEHFRELAKFKEEHGTCLVPVNCSKYSKLCTWVNHQRRQCKKWKEGKPCHITEDRIKALDKIGFNWYPKDRSPIPSHESAPISDDLLDSDLSGFDFRPSKRQRKG
jgi:hypothetical protein